MRSVLAAAAGVKGALRYELVRIARLRSVRGPVFLALLASAVLTLPAARHMVGLAYPLPPASPSHSPARHSYARPGSLAAAAAAAAALVRQYSPAHGGGPWVVGGGTVGMVLPGAAAACAAAWLGATSIGHEYRGRGLLTFALLPQRVSVLVAKALVSAGMGALLCLAATAAAYGTAYLGFHLAGVRIDLPVQLMLSQPRAVALAALGGALGVAAGVTLRIRMAAAVAAVLGCALAASVLPRSTSLLSPYLDAADRRLVRLVPGVTYTAMLYLTPALVMAVLALAGLVAVRRRRPA